MESPDGVPLFLSDRFRSALAALLTAFDYAQDSGVDRWQFAVEMTDLQARGATLADLRWLILRGFAEHAKETTTPGDATRSFRPLAATSFPPDAHLVLTPAGAAALRLLLSPSPSTEVARNSPSPSTAVAGNPPSPSMGEGRGDGAELGRNVPHSPSPYSGEGRGEGATAFPSPQPLAPSPQAAPRPIWDPSHRELRFNGQVIKRYRVPAPNQELIIAAFQEEGWPEFIDDPLPPKDEIDPKHRLQVTIKSLNRNQLTPLIRFYGNGNGLQVHWEAVQPD